VAVEQIGKVLEQLCLGQRVDAAIEVRPDAADRPGVGLDRLRLQALEPQVLEVGVVLALEIALGRCCHGRVTS
jgi:hypothetical protein